MNVVSLWLPTLSRVEQIEEDEDEGRILLEGTCADIMRYHVMGLRNGRDVT